MLLGKFGSSHQARVCDGKLDLQVKDKESPHMAGLGQVSIRARLTLPGSQVRVQSNPGTLNLLLLLGMATVMVMA